MKIQKLIMQTDEEIVQTISPSLCPKGHRPCDGDCHSWFLDWLKREYKEDK